MDRDNDQNARPGGAEETPPAAPDRAAAGGAGGRQAVQLVQCAFRQYGDEFMAKKIERTTTVGEAAKQLEVSAAAIAKACKDLGIDLAKRDPKHLKNAEIAQLRKHLAKNKK